MVSCPEPLDQGHQGTCCAYAIANVLAGMLRLKYAVNIPLDRVVTVVKTVSNCCDGSQVEQVCRDWNEAEPSLESSGNRFVYNIQLECEKVNFEVACNIVRQHTGTCCVVVVYDANEDEDDSDQDSTSDDGLRAVAAFAVVDGPDLVCVNSWGEKKMHVYLGKEQLHEAIVITVEITDVSQQGIDQPLPDVTRLYSYQEERMELENNLSEGLSQAKAEAFKLKKLLSSVLVLTLFILVGIKIGIDCPFRTNADLICQTHCMKSLQFCVH